MEISAQACPRLLSSGLAGFPSKCHDLTKICKDDGRRYVLSGSQCLRREISEAEKTVENQAEEKGMWDFLLGGDSLTLTEFPGLKIHTFGSELYFEVVTFENM